MEAAELRLREWFAFCVVAVVVWRRSARFVGEGGSEGLLLRSEFALIVAIEFAFEFISTDGVDGIRFIFGVDETGAIAYVVDFRRFDVVFGSTVLVEMMVGRLRCILC